MNWTSFRPDSNVDWKKQKKTIQNLTLDSSFATLSKWHDPHNRAEMADDVKTRVGFLTECITYNVFMYTTRGLFECDKLIFTAQMAFQILIMKKEVNPVELDFLLRFISYFSLYSNFMRYQWIVFRACLCLESQVLLVTYLCYILRAATANLSQARSNILPKFDNTLQHHHINK